ncbi:MAG TPA: amidase [Solirubrobacterales bacterium]|nr:amidase [Solirubrobacterales bacterium]
MSSLDLPLREQAAQIAAGDLDPGELLDACLARIEERNADLNAVVATFPDESRRMLEQAPEGPLRGVPVLIKDEWPLPWRAETVGAASVPGVKLAPGESGPYRALRDAGAVIAGVGNMHELGSSSTGNASLYGAAHNPWDLDRCPGGSSSGPAAAVAGGLVGGAVGADGLGSIRYPAAYCGLTGLKPTFGRSTMEGHHIANSETIVSGPLCRDAADCRLLASVLFEDEIPSDRPSGLRIGVIRDPFWSDSAPGVREACETALESLRGEVDGEVVEVELPELDLVLPAALLVAQAEEAVHLTPKNLNALSPELGVINRGVLKLRALLPLSLTARAFRIRAKARRDLANVFDKVDLLAWPTVPAVAPPLAEPLIELPSGPTVADAGNGRQGVIANLTGVPGVSVPVGLDDGMPVALQLLAAWGADALLLDAAEALERATDREFVELRPAAVA